MEPSTLSVLDPGSKAGMTSGEVLGVVTVLLALPADRLESQQTMAFKGRVKPLAVTVSRSENVGAGGKALWQARFKAG
ncbi:MAG: hypothetical protein CML24_07395 [Rhizobiales bacterium]|nr:hypothetical protein [Hyphomicrobiales bacterium]|tara:strand:+ start:438 stop:671 length:234 start_codon:yes stop_codon:yes gene_type:complete